MKLIKHTKPKMIISDEGYLIRSKNDVYVEEHYDEDGNLIEKHVPYYTTTIFVPDNFTEEQMDDLYIEELVDIERE